MNAWRTPAGVTCSSRSLAISWKGVPNSACNASGEYRATSRPLQRVGPSSAKVATRTNPPTRTGLPHLRDIAGSVGRRGEKVEGSTVMPDGISGRRKRRVQNIGLDPSDGISPRAETTTGYGECGGREIEDREIVIARVQQVIDQS